jgi:hypothetical protein
MASIEILNLSLSGDCSLGGNGQINLLFTGGTPGYTVQSVPPGGTLPYSGYNPGDYTEYVASNLSAGQYFLEIRDSGAPLLVTTLPIFISSGSTILIDAEGTTCEGRNGTITASTTNNFGQCTFDLYNSLDNLVTTQIAPFGSSTTIFTNLSADTYYVIGDDGGGCTGQSASVIIKSSTTFDYGAYIVNDSSCVSTDGLGKIFITGLTTPTSAYTINWISNVNGQTGTTITGLTQGLYTVEITNDIGCKNTQAFQVDKVPNLGIGALIVTESPSCFNSDGEVNVIVTGGTAPYYYYGSNGEAHVDFATNYTFTGLPGGNFTVTVTDAGLCSANQSISLNTPNGFGGVSIATTNSTCNNNNGIIEVTLGFASPGVYTYELSGSSGTLQVTTNGGTQETFSNLPSDNYIITVSNNSKCVFTGTTSINNVEKFKINTVVSGTTCGSNDGEVSITLTSGTTGSVASLPVQYSLVGPFPNTTSINSTAGIINGLASGNYNLNVTDSAGCTQSESIYITPSNNVDFILDEINPSFGNDGQIQVLITSGEPPFILNWSPNVSGQTGTTVTGLTSGSYTLEVIDDNGCSQIKSVTLSGTRIVTGFQSYNISTENFTNVDSTGKRGILQMFNEGFYDLTSGDTNCIITGATFTIQATIGSETKEDLFYTSTGLDDYPTDYLWGQTIKSILEEFIGVGDVIIDFNENTIKITNDCDEIEKNCRVETYNLLNDERIIINLIIDYDIACVACA